MDKEKKECQISKSEKKLGVDGKSFDEITLTVMGNDLKEVEKIFDRKWLRT